MDYIQKIGLKYWIIKWDPDNQKRVSFGSYPNLEDAQKVRDCLISVNFGLSIPDNLYINYNKLWKKYIVRKYKGKECIFQDWFDTFEEAKECRDLMIKCGWDIENTNGAGDMTSDELKYGANFKKSEKTMYKSEVGGGIEKQRRGKYGSKV